jgi:flagellar hook-associated protein 2
MGIGVGGLISGLDTDSLISQIMAIERRPIVSLQQEEAEYQTQISSLGNLKGALSALQASLAPLQEADSFISMTASSGNMNVLAVSASNDAAAGQYQVEVTALAQAQQVRSSAYTGSDDVVGAGTLTIQVGSGSMVDINIDSTNNTLAEIAAAINDSAADVTATVVNDGSGNYYLTLASNETGAANTISLTMSDDDGNNTDAAGLSNLYTDPATSSLTQTQGATNAQLTVNGIVIERAGNVIDDLMDGLTFAINDADPGNPFTIKVTENSASVTNKLQAFADKYNALIDTLNGLQKFNPETGQAGPLLGDSTAKRIQSKMQSLFYAQVDGISSDVNRLSSLGLEMDRHGKISLDGSTLTSALEDHREDVINFFSQEELGNDGIAHRFDDVIESYVKSDGLLTSKENGLKSSIEDIGEQVDQIEFRIQIKEESLRQQFSNLEQLLANFEATSGSLQGQLQSLSNLNAQIYQK